MSRMVGSRADAAEPRVERAPAAARCEGEGVAPRIVGRYQLGRELGRGGMGIVVEGYDPLLDRAVAIKIIDETRERPELHHALRREAQVVARLDHPSIVSVHDLVEDDDRRLHVVMPLVRGVTLRDLMAGRPLGAKVAVELGIRMCEALQYSHGRGVVHRDIKPENVMVVEHTRHQLRIKLMDFGLARRPGEQDEPGRVRGTAGYLSPEQAAGAAVDERSDLYSLGVVLFECLTGTLPHDPRAETALPSSVPAPLVRLVRACLQPEPVDRPASAEQVASALRALAGLVDEPVARLMVHVNEEPGVAADRRTALLPLEASAAVRGASTADVEPLATSRPLGAVLLLHGEYDSAWHAFALERASRAGSRSILEEVDEQRWLANLAHKRARYEEAIEHCDRALGWLGELGAEVAAVEASLHAWAALCAVAAGWLPAARERIAKAEERCRGGTPGRELERTLTWLWRARGNLRVAEARLELAVDALARAVEHGGRCDDPWERSIARFNLGEAQALQGRVAEALDNLRLAESEKIVLGDRWGLAYLYHARGSVHLDRGALDQAEHDLSLGGALAEAIGDPKLIALLDVARGWLAALRGRTHEATLRACAALEVARSHHAQAEQSAALTLQAHLHAAMGRPRDADAFARAALELAAPTELRMVRTAALVQQARARAAQGEVELAAEALDEAAELVREWDNPVRQLEVEVARLEVDVVHRGHDGLEERASACRRQAGSHGAVLLLSRAELVSAQLAARRGLAAEAERLRATALGRAERCGAWGLIERTSPASRHATE